MKNYKIQNDSIFDGDIIATVTDNSLSPSLPAGCTVIVSQTRKPKNGDIVLTDSSIKYFENDSEVIGVIERAIIDVA